MRYRTNLVQIPARWMRAARQATLAAATAALALLPLMHTPTAQAQALEKQLSRMDFTVGGIAEVRKSTDGHTPVSSGVNYAISQTGSTSTGGIATFHYTVSKLLGYEFNFKMTEVTDGYTLTPALAQTANPFTVQSRVSEYSGGYVYHGPTFGKIKSFASVGFGTTKFKPTPHGGEGLNEQYRATEYASIGFDDPVFTKNIGIRVQVRGVFFKPPDYGQNYLTTNAHTYALEPVFGFYFHF